MSKTQVIDPEQLRDLLDYDRATGVLYWKVRGPSLFADTKRRSSERNAAWWNGRFAGKRACKPDSNKGYLRVGIFGKEYLAHRVVWAIETGAWPVATIDHIDGDKANNRIGNLREASTSENNRNRANFGKSQYRGVSWRTAQSTWIAAIKTDGQVTFLGTFDSEADAARAYDRAAIVQHGQFARTNFPQADYEARIRSALRKAPAPDPVGEAVARVFVEHEDGDRTEFTFACRDEAKQFAWKASSVPGWHTRDHHEYATTTCERALRSLRALAGEGEQ